MSEKRWRRYRPPSEPEDESGRAATSRSEPTSSRKSSRPSANDRKPSAKSGKKSGGKDGTKGAQGSRRRTSLIVGGVAAVGVLTAAGVAVERANDDRTTESEIDRGLLDAEFISSGVAEAEAKVQEGSPVEVYLHQYALEVEFYDRTADETRTYEKNDYVEGYQVTVEDNEFPDYRPKPITLDQVDAAVLIAVADRAIEEADEAYMFSVSVKADPETDKVRVVGQASGYDADATVTAELDGEVLSVERD